MAHWDTLDQDWRILDTNRVVDAELSVRVVTHRVEVVCMGHKAGM